MSINSGRYLTVSGERECESVKRKSSLRDVFPLEINDTAPCDVSIKKTNLHSRLFDENITTLGLALTKIIYFALEKIHYLVLCTKLDTKETIFTTQSGIV